MVSYGNRLQLLLRCGIRVNIGREAKRVGIDVDKDCGGRRDEMMRINRMKVLNEERYDIQKRIL